MHLGHSKIENATVRERWRRYRWRGSLAVCFLLEMTSALIGSLQPEINVIWVANGLLLAYVLLAPRWRWRWYFAAGFAGQLAGGLVAHTHPWPIVLSIVILNLAEIAMAAILLRRRSTQLPRFTDRSFLARFVAFGVIASPAMAGLLFSSIAHAWIGLGLWPEFRDWFTTDALGIAVATPAFVAIFRTRFKETLGSPSALVYPLLLAVAAPLVFHQGKIPAMAVIFPLLVLIQLRLGLAWASLATLYIAGIGSSMVVGPDEIIPANPLLGSVGSGLRMQLLLASMMFNLYAISVVVENLRSTQRKLSETVYLHNLVTENSRDVIMLADFQGSRSYVSKAGASVGGWEPEQMSSVRSLLHLVHPDDRAAVTEVMEQLRAGRDGAIVECRFQRIDGNYIWVESNLRVIRDRVSGTPTGILNMIRDISERKNAEQLRAFHQSLLGAIHEVSLDGILVVDDEGRAVSYNRRFAEVWQIAAPDVPRSLLQPTIEVLDQRLLEQCIDKTSDPEDFLARMQELYDNRKADDNCQVELKDGRTLERYSTTLHSDDGRYLGRVWFFRDVTDRIRAEKELKAAYAEVERLAVEDALTGLANRRRFDEYLRAEWRRALRAQQPLSMLLVDADLFKLYNDTYGHLQGDMCLRQIADSARYVVTRAGDLVARFGGEEFAIVLPHTDEAGAWRIAQQLSDAVNACQIAHQKSPYGVVTISTGCATVLPQPGLSSSLLIERADYAMYEAKRLGRNRVCVRSDDGRETVETKNTFMDQRAGI